MGPSSGFLLVEAVPCLPALGLPGPLGQGKKLRGLTLGTSIKCGAARFKQGLATSASRITGSGSSSLRLTGTTAGFCDK